MLVGLSGEFQDPDAFPNRTDLEVPAFPV